MNWLPLRQEWTGHAEKTLARLPATLQRRIFDAIDLFAETGEGDVIQLHGRDPEEHRLRVGGWRVLFWWKKSERLMRIRRIAPRGDVY
ncbi:MAG: type II toxin-antitoxin system RelE/ParE family toxin [Candidatus Poribacteria bacterium]|nr:type II toxin-antitoxin system RelE/ParE family toxin [Candidatus Poribacteria bacterium]